MTLDKSDAAKALADIEHSRSLSFHLYSYRTGAPYFIVWGLMWLVADLANEFKAAPIDAIWPLASLVGSLACFVIAWLQFRARRQGAAVNAWRGVLVSLLAFGFVVCTFSVFAPFDGRQTHTFAGLVIGFGYAVAGLWLGWRLIAVSAALIALSLFGFFQIHEHYEAYMAVVGGGCLMLGGLWLRKV